MDGWLAEKHSGLLSSSLFLRAPVTSEGQSRRLREFTGGHTGFVPVPWVEVAGARATRNEQMTNALLAWVRCRA